MLIIFNKKIPRDVVKQHYSRGFAHFCFPLERNRRKGAEEEDICPFHRHAHDVGKGREDGSGNNHECDPLEKVRSVPPGLYPIEKRNEYFVYPVSTIVEKDREVREKVFDDLKHRNPSLFFRIHYISSYHIFLPCESQSFLLNILLTVEYMFSN